MKIGLCCAAALLSMCAAVGGAELSETHRAAALEFLRAKGTPQLLERNGRIMLEKQLAAAPEYAEHRAELEKFYLSTFGFEALKDDLAAMYAAEYSEDELKNLTAFYSTPLGRKSVTVEEKLVPAFSALLERRTAERVKAAQGR